MAVNKEIVIKVTADANGAVKTVDNLTKSTDKLNTSTDNTGESIDHLSEVLKQTDNGMVDLSASISSMEDRMYQLALQGKQNEEEFITLQEEVIKYKDAIISTDSAVDQLIDQGSGLKTALQLGSTVVAGYGAVKGAMSLVGAESEDLQQAFVKLQAVQATLASIEQLRINLDKQSLVMIKAKAVATTVLTKAQTIYTTAIGATTGAMKLLRIAMLALPIIAIIAGIVALIAIIASLFEANQTAQESYDNLTKSIDQNNEALDRSYAKSKRNAENQIALAKAQGASAQEIHDLELKLMADEEAYRKIQIKNLSDQIKQRREIYKTALAEGNTELALSIKDEIAQERKKYKDLLDMEGQYQMQVKIKQTQFDRDRAKEQETKDKEELDKRKKQWDELQKRREEAEKLRVERQQIYEDLITKNIQDENLRRIAEMNLQHERERTQLIDKFGQDTELLKQLTIQQEDQRNRLIRDLDINAQEDRLKAELSNTKLSFEERNKLLREQAEQERRIRLDNDHLTADQRIIIENEYLGKLDAIRSEEQARDFENNKSLLEARLITMREDFEAEQELKAELYELELEQALANEALTLGEREKLQAEYNNKIIELAEERKQREIDIQNEIREATINTMTAGISAIGDLSDAYFANKLAQAQGDEKAMLAIEKRRFEQAKKIQIAQATIAGIQGVINALTAQSIIPEPFGTILKGINAVAVAATTFANISKIRSQTFDGVGGGISAPAVPSINPPEIGEIINNVDSSNNEFPQIGSNNNNQPTVTIVDSEIKASQDNLSKVKTISSLG